MRIKNTDTNFGMCIISLNGVVMIRGDILEASEEEGKIWYIDHTNPLGYRVVFGVVDIRITDILTATQLVRAF
jgi:hypothetical protein